MERLIHCTEIINLLPVGIFWKDINGKYLGCNKYHAEHAGLKNPEAIVGRTDFDLVWKEYAEEYAIRDREVIETGQSHTNYEHVIGTKARTIWSRTFKTPLYEQGKVCGVLGIWIDMSEVADGLASVLTGLSGLASKTKLIDEKLDTMH